MMQYLKNILGGIFGLKYPKTEKMDHTQSIVPVFDPKYKTVLYVPPSGAYYEMMSWVNDNTSSRSADVKLVNHGMYVAFEDKDDALIFKIKFL